MIVNNPNDPLKRTGPPAGQVLLEKFGQQANEFPLDAVLDAATNVVINVIRQSCRKRGNALETFDLLFNRAKTALAAHYDGVTGDRRNVFAHTQHIVMDTFKDPEGL